MVPQRHGDLDAERDAEQDGKRRTGGGQQGRGRQVHVFAGREQDRERAHDGECQRQQREDRHRGGGGGGHLKGEREGKGVDIHDSPSRHQKQHSAWFVQRHSQQQAKGERDTRGLQASVMTHIADVSTGTRKQRA